MVRRAYKDQLADTYDDRRFHGAGGQYVNQRELNTVVEALPETTQKVLDVPSGTGRVSLHLSQLGYSVTSLDLSADMLQLISGQSKAPTPILADAQILPVATASFDACICLRFLHFFGPDKQLQATNLIKELVRVVKPGGVVVIDSNRWSPRHWGVGRNRLSTVYCHDDAEVENMLLQGGLQVRYRKSMFFLAPILYRHLPQVGVPLVHKLETVLPARWRVRAFWGCQKQTTSAKI